jgi:hypothetical protein
MAGEAGDPAGAGSGWTEGAAEAGPPSGTALERPERRGFPRHAVDASATLTLVKGGISMRGRIVNLSQSGCRVRTDERFQVGIYTRIETEFHLNGIAFRLGGVSQAILNPNTIGIRFLEMSERKRDQLSELIAEIAKAEQANRPA